MFHLKVKLSSLVFACEERKSEEKSGIIYWQIIFMQKKRKIKKRPHY